MTSIISDWIPDPIATGRRMGYERQVIREAPDGEFPSLEHSWPSNC